MNQTNMVTKGKALCTMLLLTLVSCASFPLLRSSNTNRFSGRNQDNPVEELDHDIDIQASPERDKAYDYVFLQAAGEDKQLDDKYNMLKHCIEINPNHAAAYYEMAQMQLYLSNDSLATHFLETAHRLNPENYWYASALANMYQQRDSMQSAIDVYNNLAKIYPNKRDIRYALLQCYSTTKDYDKLVATLDTLEIMSGKSETLSMQKFQIFLQEKDSARAFKEIQGLVDEYPFDTKYRNLQADLLQKHNRHSEALQVYHKILEQEPSNGYARYGIASYYLEVDSLEKYEQNIDILLQDPKVDTKVKANVLREFVGTVKEQKMDSLKINQKFDETIASDSLDVDIPTLYASYLLSIKDDTEAKKQLEKILRLTPENSGVRMQLLQYALQSQETERVISLCQTGLEINPKQVEFYFYLAVGYSQEKEFDKTIATCEKMLQTIDNKTIRKEILSDVYTLMGDAYHEKGVTKKCFASYDKAISLNPENVGVMNNYAYFLSLDNTDLDKAEDLSHRTIIKEPENATFLDTYAWILFMQGKYPQAKMYIDQTLEHSDAESLSADVLEHAGDIYYFNNKKEEAISYWEQAIAKGGSSKMLKTKVKMKRYIR